jgi:type 1 glutamine amidotransferase
MGTSGIKTAVVTGAHPFDVPGFRDLWDSLAALDVYIQSLDDFAADAGKVRDWYDVVVLYHMYTETPAEAGEELPWYQRHHRRAAESLGQPPQGIVVLHHALVAYRDWPLWTQLVGMEERRMESYHMNERISVQVADGDHPITRGMENWEIVDETYNMGGADPDRGNTILLTTPHPRSMPTLAWTREHGRSRVFCLQSGHCRTAWENPGFRTILQRGVQWTARRL